MFALGLLHASAGISGGAADLPQAPNIFGGGPNLGPHRIQLLLSDSELVFSGDMSAGAAQELRQALDTNPGVDVLHLNSGGGLVSEGRQMFALIQQRQLITTTDKFCVSACVLAFLGGRERYLAPGARLGLHEESSDVAGKAQVAASEQTDKQTMLSLGIRADFVDKAFSTPSDQLWVPTIGELEAANVITGVSSDYVVAIQKGGTSVGPFTTAPTGANTTGIYKPPSIEETPAGVTIYRGSGAP